MTDTAVSKINKTLSDSIAHLSDRQQMFNMGPDDLRMNVMDSKLEEILRQQQQSAAGSPNLDIERSPDGKVISIGGRPVRRGLRGELSGVE